MIVKWFTIGVVLGLMKLELDGQSAIKNVKMAAMLGIIILLIVCWD
jgi:hypothetical protein